METCPGEGVLKFPHSRKPSHRQVCGDFWNLRRQHNREKEKKNPEKCGNGNFPKKGSNLTT